MESIMSLSPKEILFEDDARIKLSEGIEKLSKLVSVTMGPKGRNIGLSESYGSPSITSDGNKILSDISFKDQYVDMGASMAKEVAEKIKDTCGDGTTRAIVLLNSLVSHGIQQIAAGASPISIKRGMDKATTYLIKEIEKLSKSIETKEEIASLARASASGSEEVGTFIAEAFEKAGKDGVITIEEGKSRETSIELVEGMQFDKGYLSSYFCTDAESMTVTMTNPKILVTSKKISSIHEIMDLLQNVAASSSEILIIAEDIEGDALSTLVINKLRNIVKVCAVKAPGFGDKRKQMLEDIAILTGATVVSEDKGMTLKETTFEALGTCSKAKITKDSTTLVGGAGSKDSIVFRIKEIERELAESTNNYDKEKLLERKAKLSGGVAIIKVGAPTETEMKQKQQLFQDSLNSTKAALSGGVIPGGGITLLKAARDLKEAKLNREEQVGFDLVIKAAEAPFRQLVANSGLESSVIIDQVLSKEFNVGFNVVTETVENMVAANITDPTKVEINLLKLATSMAGVVLFSEALIIDAEEDQE